MNNCLLVLSRRCVTAVLVAFAANSPLNSAEPSVVISELAPLDALITSFGAAVADGYLYVYGGHLGSPHDYSVELQHNKLLRLNLAKPGQWEVVAEGPRRTGLAMVSYENQLYRIGGWEAKNAAGEKWELYSTRDFARFDAKTGEWQPLTPLPQGRSSHDAALLGSQLYVIGGWEMRGKQSSEWHDTAWMCDLADAQSQSKEPQWKEIAKPPFHRRALAVAAYAGKVYAIGGMDDSNDTTTALSIYDPQSNAWSQGPALPGASVEGFGASAFGPPRGLFANGRSGAVFQLAADGQSWHSIGQLNHPRMSHRLVAIDDSHLVVVGGTASSGKVSAVEVLDIKIAPANR